MKKFYYFAVVALMAVMVSCNNESQTTETQAKNPEEKEAIDQPQSPTMQAARLGTRLALYGYENESAEALIEAANILANVVFEKANFQVTRGGSSAEETEEEMTEARSFAPADLLAAARAIAGEDATLLAMIQRVEEKLAAAESAERGSTNGVRTFDERVKREAFDEYHIEFQAGQAVCSVIGDGSTDLDLYICDEDMNLIVEDVDYTDNCYCTWTPKETAVYVIRIYNRGNKANNYSMFIN